MWKSKKTKPEVPKVDSPLEFGAGGSQVFYNHSMMQLNLESTPNLVVSKARLMSSLTRMLECGVSIKVFNRKDLGSTKPDKIRLVCSV